ncbi:hypothetical protein I3F58_12890 [Streptomyces sp. MUM 203J]|uniref:hypothetical protein n=1 Tax=Streptomyces sp. MUM 203J TaxID=2791990 RepID=UPI001F04F329|nr:hypothetical protein [Streptomyces sp. MUM 203J]MCH0540450.1 hypothetical protein [Streptomyces sp. MUM 203J]
MRTGVGTRLVRCGAVLAGGALLVLAGAPAGQGREPRCGGDGGGGTGFPIRTRIVGGPAVYLPGEGAREWYVELSNTTGAECRSVHPVIVLSDRAGVLGADQVRLEFAEPGAGRGGPWPVRVEETEAYEVVGVLDHDGFAGFTVPPGGTVRVPVRLGFAAGAEPGAVTANAAVVQRRGDDGDWVGESGDYRFAVGAEAESAPSAPATAEPGRLARTGGGGSAAGPLAVAAAVAAGAGAGAVAVGRWTRRRWG